MRTLDDLLHPITPDRFFAEFHGRKPLHIPADEGAPKRALLDWRTFNSLLNQPSIWTAQSLKLVRDTQPVPPEQYCRSVQTQSGAAFRPDPAKVALFLTGGASLIAGDVQDLTPPIAALSAALGRPFAAAVGANIYCSFKGVQAFGTHFDLTDVFAVQTEGEKLWRLYESCADAPVEMPSGVGDVRRWFEQTRGRLQAEIVMKPGDVLYLPRGWYHDALAQDTASLHVTFSLASLHGRIIFNLLEQAAMQDSAFRAYLPAAEKDGGRALQQHLADLGRRLAQLTASPTFRDEVAMTQERLTPRTHSFALPARAPLTQYKTNGLLGPAYEGPVAHAMHWALSQPAFALEEVIAQFDFVPEADIRAAVDQAEKTGVLKRV
ncbi:JmjC domain-containing protein [Brevundimonas naejangsanensis]|nr:cupin domain-containing protein [Brevundimonas naejangsanensis]